MAAPDGRRAGFFLLPDGVSKGSLETLYRRSADPTIARCVDALFACTPNPGQNVARRDKAWVGAYLAALRGNARVDQALDPSKGRLLDVSGAHFDPLRQFVRDLTTSPAAA